MIKAPIAAPSAAQDEPELTPLGNVVARVPKHGATDGAAYRQHLIVIGTLVPRDQMVQRDLGVTPSAPAEGVLRLLGTEARVRPWSGEDVLGGGRR